MNKIKRICTFVVPAIFLCIQLSTNLHKFRNLRELNCTDSSDDAACVILQWKGEPLVELPKENKIEATVVISYCGGEDMNAFERYLDERSENINVREVTIISGCESEQSFRVNIPRSTVLKSQWKDPELNFIEWLTVHLESAMSKSLPAHFNDENHVIIFLSSRALSSGRIRTLDEVVQSAMENRFGCILRPQEGVSYYHLPKKLRSFKSQELKRSQTRYYNNFGEWIDNLKLTKYFDGLVPVCYSSSFAIKSRDLLQTPEGFYEVLEAIQSDYKKHEYRELIEFMERSIGAIFSLPLSEKKALEMSKYSTAVHPINAYSGALIKWSAHGWFRIFVGDTLEKQYVDLSYLRLTLVVSYCNEDMTWMNEYFKDLNMQHVTIISKCNLPIKGFNPPGAEIWTEPNVGRCDHSYAKWMEDMKAEDATENHIVLFMKASRFLYQRGMRYRPIQDVIRIAVEHGFSCEAAPVDKSAFFRTDLHRAFLIAHHHKAENIKSPYENLGAWVDALGVELPSPLTPVCYGGNFAVKATQIYSKKDLWSKMVESLSRGDNIEEGHFAERSWAGILSYPLNAQETAVMSSIPIRHGAPRGPYGGQIHLNE